MAVQPTASVKAEIKKHKRIFEKDELFTYTLKYESETYHQVRYTRFGKGSGYLILTADGKVVPLAEAKAVIKQFDTYNTCIVSATTRLFRYKENPIHVLIELKELLPQLEPFGPTISNDVEHVIALADTYVREKERLNAIYEEMRQMDIEVQQKRGFLTITEVERADAYIAEMNGLLYDSLRQSRATLPAFKRLHKFIQHNYKQVVERTGHAKRLHMLLRAFTHSRNIRTLEQTLQGFEKDEWGKPFKLSPGKKGLQELEAIGAREGELNMERNIYPLLRNR